MRPLIALLILPLFITPAHAADTPSVTITETRISGSGCPEGTAHATLSPDNTALSILFDEFKSAAGGTAPARDRAKCAVRAKLAFANRYQVQVAKVDVRGFNALEESTAARVRLRTGFEIEFFGWRIPIAQFTSQKIFQGPATDSFDLSSEATMPRWTPCTHNVTLVMETQLDTVSLTGTSAETTVDSLDTVTAPMSAAIKFRKCRK